MIKNAIVRNTFLGYDHGILTSFLHIEFESSSQCFGGYSLDRPNEQPSVACGAFIAGVLKTLEIDSWEKIVKIPCRVEIDEKFDTIIRIGHFVKDKWFDPKTIF
ncbi:MAG: hypothetical protein WCY37_03525 [Candidatus Dojkabacteria bacterium]